MPTIWTPQRSTPSWSQGFARSQSESASPNLWTGLEGLWVPALGPTGLQLFDVSGRHSTGTLTNMDPATDWVPGDPRVGGYVLDFDGSNDTVNVPSNAALDSLSTKLSFSVRFRLTGTLGGFDTMFGRTTSSSWNDGFGLRYDNGAREWEFWVNAFNTDFAFIPFANNDLEWHTLAGVAAAGQVRMFLDGAEGGTSDTYPGTISTPDRPFVIGAAGNVDQFTKVEIGSLALYSRGLAPAETATLAVDPLRMLRRRQRTTVSVAGAAPAGFVPYPRPLLDNMTGGMAT